MSQEERKRWDEVLLASQPLRSRLAKSFLDKHPDSEVRVHAHYLIAVEAYEQGRFEDFSHHGERALKLLEKAAESDSRQVLRRLQLHSQLSYFYAESGQADRALELAGKLLDLLSASGKENVLPESHWKHYRDTLAATAHYSAGRALLQGAMQLQAPERRGAAMGQARERLEAAIALNPLDGYAHFRLAAAHRAAANPQEAIRSLARAASAGGPAAAAALKALEAPPRPNQDTSEILDEARKDLRMRMSRRPRAVFSLPDGRSHPALWWDAVPETVRQASLTGAPFSNIRRQDYSGPDSCRPCHRSNFEGWSKHPHRWMNAVAGDETVLGDFSGKASIQYRGGRATFFRNSGSFRMRLSRDGISRTYSVNRTIGSRFFQYYVGRLVEGPEARNHPVRNADHVLPFGYWLDEEQWVPVVHISVEHPDQEREDPFAGPADTHYDRSCSACHTTRPAGDWLLSSDGRLRLGRHSPRTISLHMSKYLAENHPELLSPDQPLLEVPIAQASRVLGEGIDYLPAQTSAVALGVSCEACHNGALEHVNRSERDETEQPPLFFLAGADLYVEDRDAEAAWGRTSRNLNWTCARCHSGDRPQYAGGMDTWNSTEYSDAQRGFCYDAAKAEATGMEQLTCVHCHNPHYATGKSWTKTADQDDAKCLSCHPGLEPDEARSAHTRHPLGSEGSRCMNCHMPRINEGLQEMVRTHQIFKPTQPEMIEAGQPNACNLCHLDKSIDWTLENLSRWYGRSYSSQRLRDSYPDRVQPLGTAWLRSPHPATRLSAAEALGRARALWALPELVEMLDDPYLVNRQFTQRRVEQMLGIDLEERFGYRFYMFASERRGPLGRLRAAIEQGLGSGSAPRSSSQ